MLNINLHNVLRDYLKPLADHEYQKRVWPEPHKSPHPVRFIDILHFLFDDSPLAEDPEDCVGGILRDWEEVEHVRKVTTAIEAVLDKYGTRLDDIDYIKVPEWDAVLAAAKAALEVVSVPIPPLPPEAEELVALVHDSHGSKSREGELAYLGAMHAFETAYRKNLRSPGYFFTPEWRETFAAVKRRSNRPGAARSGFGAGSAGEMR